MRKIKGTNDIKLRQRQNISKNSISEITWIFLDKCECVNWPCSKIYFKEFLFLTNYSNKFMNYLYLENIRIWNYNESLIKYISFYFLWLKFEDFPRFLYLLTVRSGFLDDPIPYMWLQLAWAHVLPSTLQVYFGR